MPVQCAWRNTDKILSSGSIIEEQPDDDYFSSGCSYLIERVHELLTKGRIRIGVVEKY
jgi:hypothetical protein